MVQVVQIICVPSFVIMGAILQYSGFPGHQGRRFSKYMHVVNTVAAVVCKARTYVELVSILRGTLWRSEWLVEEICTGSFGFQHCLGSLHQ